MAACLRYWWGLAWGRATAGLSSFALFMVFGEGHPSKTRAKLSIVACSMVKQICFVRVLLKSGRGRSLG